MSVLFGDQLHLGVNEWQKNVAIDGDERNSLIQLLERCAGPFSKMLGECRECLAHLEICWAILAQRDDLLAIVECQRGLAH